MEYEEIELADMASEIEKDVQAHKLYWKVTVDLYHQDNSKPNEPTNVRTFVFQVGEPKANDDETEDMLLYLFDISLRKRIVMAHRERSELELGKVYGYRLDLEDSKDGQTNITSELIDALATIKTEYEPKAVMSFK